MRTFADDAVVLEREDDAREVGLGLVWDSVIEQDETPSRWMLLGILGALAAYMAESGIYLTSQTPADEGIPRSSSAA